MAMVYFSVPDDVKQEFDRCFAWQNKNAILSRLMQDAIEQHKRQLQRNGALEGVLEFSKKQPAVSEEEVAKTRQELRELFLT
jgi:metal-responsive CopG/Arc/MetJ family transcriptional regulator